jgi:hypothetical protein
MSLQGNTTWSLLVGMLLVTLVMYNSYRRYFAMKTVGSATQASNEPAKSYSAAAGQ